MAAFGARPRRARGWRHGADRLGSIRAATLFAALFLLALWLANAAPDGEASASDDLRCDSPNPVDGDTFRCAGERIRLANIDAPEMPGHCRAGRVCTPGDPHASRDYLAQLTRGEVTCRRIATDRYGRTIALCQANGRDLSCAMAASGYAVERYGRLDCRDSG